jgi:Flp pilus assembly protein TadD
MRRRKSSQLREKVGLDVALLYLQNGDLGPARQSLLDVVSSGGDGPSSLIAARRLLQLQSGPSQEKSSEVALETVTKLSPDAEERHDAAAQLLAAHAKTPLKEARLVNAYRALLDSPRAREALSWLRSFYERHGDGDGLRDAYRTAALLLEDRSEGRALALEAVRASADTSLDGTIERWLWLWKNFGPDREAHRELLPMLERAARYDDLRRVIEAEIEIAPVEERPQLLARLGELLSTHLGALDEGLAALHRCLVLDATNRLARATLERLMKGGGRRLEAAQMLAPLYEAEGSRQGRLAVLETLAALSPDAGARLAALVRAVDAAMQAGQAARAASLCRQALNLDASSPDLHRKYDELMRGKEQAAERLARYEDALSRAADPARCASLHRTVAAIRHAAGDVQGAMHAWSQALVHSPADATSFHRLIDATIEQRDDDAVLPLLERACAALQGRELSEMTLRKARWLAEHDSGDLAVELCRSIVDQALSPEQLEAIVEIARDQDDDVLHRHALELISACGDAQASRQGLERLGDFQYDRLGDRRAAAGSWKAAAQTYGEGDKEHATALYERALETLPDDLGAAERLIDLYASIGAWVRLLDVLRLFIRSGDLGRAAQQLLRFRAEATEAGASDEFLALAGEIISQLGSQQPDWLVPLKRARAHVLLADPGRQAEASEALHELIESLAQEDDVRTFETFIESSPNASDRHRERRWLYRWRTGQAATDEGQIAVLIEWARAELEYGDPDAARSVYERLLELNPAHRDSLDAVCRLRLQAGDYDGGLRALARLTEQAGLEGPAITIGMAGWIWSSLERPGEAARVLAGALAVDPGSESARDLARRMFADPAACAEAVARLEAAANDADDRIARQILELLMESREQIGEPPQTRQQWVEKIIALSSDDPDKALGWALQGVVEMPDAIRLWDAAESVARKLGRLEAIVDAFHRVFVEQAVPASLAATLGPRMVSLADESSVDPAASVPALLRLLDAMPEARWALDRVKLALSGAARWTELFGLYDRAVVALPNDRERADLLSEAAFAARDLAADATRAVRYFEFLRALRPDDATVDGALERLYQKLGLKRELIALLTRSAEGQVGFRLREIELRVTQLWLDLGETAQANAVVERMLGNGAQEQDLLEFLERIAHPAMPASRETRAAAARAVERLEAHYARTGSVDDTARVAEAKLALAEEADERARAARAWLAILLSRSGPVAAWAGVIDRVESRIADDPVLCRAVYRTLLVKALHAWRDGGAADGHAVVLRVVDMLVTLLSKGAEPIAAARLLRRAARLPFARGRRRELLHRAAIAYAEAPGATEQALATFDALFDEDASDDVAQAALPEFTGLLESAGEHARLAARWEQQATLRARTGDPAETTLWERAAGIWEALGERDRAVNAYRQGAALASQASFEALARLHGERAEWRDAAAALEWLGAHGKLDDPLPVALRLSDAYEKMGEGARARASLEKVLPAAQGEGHGDQVRQRLLGLYRRDGVYKPLATLLEAEARRARELPQKLALVREACEIEQSKLGDPEAATALLRLAVTWAPDDDGLRRWLLDALESLGRWDEAAGHLRHQLAALGERRSKDRALLHQRLARALAKAGRSAEALAELRTAADMSPGEGAILYDLARTALDVGQLDLAESTYRTLLFALHRPGPGAPTTAPGRADALVDLAEIAMRKGDVERGKELVDSAFDDAIAGEGELARLESVLDARGHHELLSRELERCARSAATLALRATAVGRWVDLWEQRLGRSPEVLEGIRMQTQRIAQDVVHEKLSSAAAWEALCRAQSVAGDPGARDRLVASLTSVAGASTDKASRGRLRVSLARLLLQQPAQDGAAIEALEGALTDDPNDRDAIALLSDALEREGRFDELATILERCLQSLGWERQTPALAAAEWRLGQALEKAGRGADALQVYEPILERDSLDGQMLSALVARLDALGSDRLADALERLMSVDPNAAPGAAKRLVDLRTRRGDAAGAARALEVAFAGDPTSADVRDRLVLHYEKTGQWDKAASALCRAIEAAPKLRVLHVKLADVYRKAGAHAELIRTLDSALATRPRDSELLALRSQAREDEGDLAGALEDLEAACAVDAKRLGALLELLERIVSRERSPAADAHLLRMADILTRLNRPKEARAALDRLRTQSPRDREALRRSAQAASADGDHVAAADAYLALVALVDGAEPPESILAVVKAVVDACQRAGRVADARRALARALDALAAHAPLGAEVEKLCEATEDWERLARLYVRRADGEAEADAKVALLVRAARMCLEECADPSFALEAVTRARALAPESIDVVLLWARTEVALGRADEALVALEDVIARDRVPRSQLAAAHLQIAKAHLSVDRLVEARNALKAAFVADPRQGDTALLLGLLSLDLEDEETAERALTMVTKAPRVEAAPRALAFYHLARMALAKGDAVKARLLATKAVEADATDASARKLLARLPAASARRSA